jgi:hypothetical protein
MIIGIHKYNHCIHENPYLFMKFKDFINFFLKVILVVAIALYTLFVSESQS